jgi:3-deoxy-D-manno-octulosonate 8-phosphate phosphatase KdsC-like HAD superfamily phosphatase|tara:strand:+ start:261 stop:443 length:183 start_codon:yes stop_codon:yes gene_type:complete
MELDCVFFVGNDMNDKDAMDLAGLPMCPSGAIDAIKEISKHIFVTKGGDGIVRGLFYLLK